MQSVREGWEKLECEGVILAALIKGVAVAMQSVRKWREMMELCN